MCTVTYIPLQSNGFILTSNRDEGYSRAQAIAPRSYALGSKIIVYPKDPDAGGTWISTSKKSNTLCLMNGAFERHERTPPYRKSRGLVVLEFYEFNTVEEFIRNYNFENIEPFTLLVIDSNENSPIGELRWDGKQVFYANKDRNKFHIWSSAALYSKEIRLQREQWFSEWLATQSNFSQEACVQFHHFAGKGEAQSNLLMNIENKVMTVSISSICKNEEEHIFYYKDVKSNHVELLKIN